jgi:integrase
VTLGALFTRCLRDHWNGQKGEATVKTHIGALEAAFGPATPVEQLPQKLSEALAVIRVGRAPSTVNRTLQTLRKALALAVEWDYLDKAPRLPRYPEPKGRVRIYTPAEEAAIFAFFKDAGHAGMVELVRILFATGFRLSEVLRSSELVLTEYGRLRVYDTKNGGDRQVPVSPAIAATVERWLLDDPPTKDQVEWRWRKMREAVFPGDTSAIIHAIRHTVCTRLLAGGMPPAKVMLWMGHADIQTTMRYCHVEADDLSSGVALVSGTGGSAVASTT